jgi:hypothetical protein
VNHVEPLLANVTSPEVAIKRGVSSFVLDIFVAMPFDLSLCDDTIGVE